MVAGERVRRVIITWFGCGESPVASGTVGSAGALATAAAWWAAVYWLAAGRAAPWLFHVGLALGAIVTVALGVAWGPWAVEAFQQHRNTRKPGDPGAFVLDEVAGQWIALLWLPIGNPLQAAGAAVMAFLLFRIFDVFKIWPANRLERLHAGWGIMLDDVAAGIWANVVGQAICRLILEWQ